MKTRVQSTVGIKCRQGFHFGTAEWIKGRAIQLLSPAGIKVGDHISLKIELTSSSEWVVSDAIVMRANPYQKDKMTRCVCKLVSLSAQDRKRLNGFVASSLDRSRDTINRVSPNISAVGQHRPEDTSTIALHQPTIEIAKDGRSVTTRWSQHRAFRRDWALHISRGRLPIDGIPPSRRAFMIRMMLPDGFVATFPAEVGEKTKSGWLMRFLVPTNA
jgi:hypothetical protein